VKAQAKGREGKRYILPLSYARLTPLYDRFMRWTMRETTFKRRLLSDARIEKGHRVLDLGCGTATLTIMAKRAHPEASVVGLDGDGKVIELGRKKVAVSGLNIVLDEGRAFALPYAGDAFDRVLSSLLFHHLSREDKVRTLGEVRRVLRPGGEFHIADLGKPANPLAYVISLVMRHLEEASDGIQGRLLAMLQDASFERVRESARFMTVFGTLSVYTARKPA
jgi:ubiquinone/menaquinone biosynthesis C-methylase UbiE